jgi:uncharacterized membrane protein YciS (DUF1049 family)
MRAILKLIGFILTLPIFIVAISFAISNTQAVALTLWPFDVSVSLPLALLIFAVLIAGFALGAIAAFLGAGRLRRRVRNAEFRVRQMEMEAARKKREAEAAAEKEARTPGTALAPARQTAPAAAE